MGLEWIILTAAVHGLGAYLARRTHCEPRHASCGRGMPRPYVCGNDSKSCFLSSIQAIMALGLAMTTDMASMAAR